MYQMPQMVLFVSISVTPQINQNHFQKLEFTIQQEILWEFISMVILLILQMALMD